MILQKVAAATLKTGASAGAMETAVVSQRTTGRSGTARGKGYGGQRSMSTGEYFLTCVDGQKDAFIVLDATM